jgi:hypothetical protein
MALSPPVDPNHDPNNSAGRQNLTGGVYDPNNPTGSWWLSGQQGQPSALGTVANTPPPNASPPALQTWTSAPIPGYEYTPQQTGGVTQNTNWLKTLFGVGGVQESPALISSLPDMGDVDAVDQAMNDYNTKMARYNHANTPEGYLEFMQKYQVAMAKVYQLQGSGASADEISKAMDAANQIGGDYQDAVNKPEKPDLLAVQAQQNRNRLLSLAKNVYDPLMRQQLGMATGTGPSAAMATYQTAADQAQRGAYGTAASANATGGQRAALFQAAMGRAANTQQAAANDAARLRLQEMQQGAQGLTNTASSLSQIYGAPNLLTDTEKKQGANQDAENKVIADNAQLREKDTTNLSSGAQGTVSSFGHGFTG